MPYSQGNEEVEILKYFGEYVGTFLDIGMNDGVTLSNTYALALRGWRGLGVEPSAIAIKKAEQNHFNHKQVHCFNCAIADYNGDAILYESGTHFNNGDTALLSSLSQEETRRWGGTTIFYEKNVDVIDVPTLLTISPYSKFDFISIDAEGNDLIILRQMNLAELGCSCICVEWNTKQDVLNEIKEYCGKYGLTKELLRNAENLILAKSYQYPIVQEDDFDSNNGQMTQV